MIEKLADNMLKIKDLSKKENVCKVLVETFVALNNLLKSPQDASTVQ